jgi:hypothetical protein
VICYSSRQGRKYCSRDKIYFSLPPGKPHGIIISRFTKSMTLKVSEMIMKLPKY